MKFNYSGISLEEISNSYNTTTQFTSVEESFKSTNDEISRLIQIIFRPILVIVGTIGNSLTIYIMRRISLKYLSTSFYMFILAVADSMVLWTGCFAKWIDILTRGRVNPETWMDCKLSSFLFYFGRHYSSMLLVLLSIEKCFAVYFPLKSKTVCTVKTAKWSTGIVGVIVAACNILHFLDSESRFTKLNGYHVCILINDYQRISQIMDSVLYSFAPFILTFVANFAIVFQFLKAKCKRNSTDSTNQALVKAATRGTALVVTVSVTFLILTAPTAVDQALLQVIHLGRNPMCRVFMNFTQYLNHSINGVLYIIVGSRFRNEFLKILCKKERPDESSASCSVGNTSVVTISGARA